MMAPYGLLDQVDEDALHAARLLNIEEKLFKRLSKRLLAPDSLLNASIAQFATETPKIVHTEAETHPAAADTERRAQEHSRWREEALLDFASFENNILRTQFLLRSNEQERQRYATEREKILQNAREVRDNNAFLQTRLDGAQRILALRKTYDTQAKKITDDATLKSRDEQDLNIRTLREEIADLERESNDYAQTWVERREQFTKIFDAGEDLLRLIRDEKEEAERKEGMEEIEHVEGDASNEVRSRTGTPKPNEHTSNQPSQPANLNESGEVEEAGETNSSMVSNHTRKLQHHSDVEEGEEQELDKMDTT